MQACTIGLSINKDPKLEKERGDSSAARSFVRSFSHVTTTLPFSVVLCQYRNTLPIPCFSFSYILVYLLSFLYNTLFFLFFTIF